MLGRIKKGESVIGMRAVRVKDWTFFKGPPIVRGSYAGKMRDWYMVQTRRMDDDIITISDFSVSVARATFPVVSYCCFYCYGIIVSPLLPLSHA